MILKGSLFRSVFSVFLETVESSKQRGYPLCEGTENSSQLEAIKLTISDYPEENIRFSCARIRHFLVALGATRNLPEFTTPDVTKNTTIGSEICWIM